MISKKIADRFVKSVEDLIKEGDINFSLLRLDQLKKFINNEENRDIDENEFIKNVKGLFSEFDDVPNDFFSRINNKDDVLENFFIYRFSKGIIDGVFSTILFMDDVVTCINKEIDREKISLKYNQEKAKSELKSKDIILMVDKLDKRLFDYTDGMEFDDNVQTRFEDVFTRMKKDLLTNSKEEKTSEFFKRISVFFRNRKVLSDFKKVFGYKDEKLDSLTKQLTVKGINKLMNKYGFREYKINMTILAFNLVNNNEKHKIEIEETIKLWKKVNRKTIELSEIDFERKMAEGINMLNIQDFDVVQIDFQLKRTTGVQELVKKGLKELDKMDLPQKVGSSQWGELGAEGGAFIEKVLLKILEKNFVSETDIPANKMNMLLYKKGVNPQIIDRYSSFDQKFCIEDLKNEAQITYDLNKVKNLPLISLIRN